MFCLVSLISLFKVPCTPVSSTSLVPVVLLAIYNILLYLQTSHRDWPAEGEEGCCASVEHNSTSIPPSLHHSAASFPTSNLATCRDLLEGPGWSLNRRTEARWEANRQKAVINTRDMEEIKGKFWWVGPLHVMTQVNVNGIYDPLEKNTLNNLSSIFT